VTAPQAKQDRAAVRSLQGELQEVRRAEQKERHALSQERRRLFLLEIVARATDESEKVKEVQFIKQLELEDSRAALDARLVASEARRAEVLASKQLRKGKEVDGVLEDAQRRKKCAFRTCSFTLRMHQATATTSPLAPCSQTACEGAAFLLSCAKIIHSRKRIKWLPREHPHHALLVRDQAYTIGSQVQDGTGCNLFASYSYLDRYIW
jgi:S-methylmethionine-dependent homocysteine/selenocysteine methylase